jgi:hypothetical protein
MDGNFSLKRFKGSGSMDECIFDSTYLILPMVVDCFKDEVNRRPCPQKGPKHRAIPLACADNWTAASSTTEGVVKIFEQTGIFLCACHHEFIETFTEMYHSGEL